MKKTWIVAGLFAALCCAACNDNDDKKIADYKPACQESDGYCTADGDRFVCINGEVVNIPCDKDKVCSGHGHCITPKTCIDAPATCSADYASVNYCSNGIPRSQSCLYGSTCVKDDKGVRCVNPTADSGCKVGVSRCDSHGRMQTCIDVGGVTMWEDNACPAGFSCQDGACVPGDSCSKKGDIRCNKNGVRQECVQLDESVALVWKDNDCATGSTCNAGLCVTEPDCINGETRCGLNNAVYLCSNKTWTKSGVCNKPGADICVAGKCEDLTTVRDLTDYLDLVYERGKSNGGGGGGGTGDVMYDCSNYEIQGYTLTQICASQEGADKSTAVCLPCMDWSQGYFMCVAPSQASQLIGKSYQELTGQDVCNAGGGGGGGGGSSVSPSDVAVNSCNLSNIQLGASCSEANKGCQAHVCAYDAGSNYEGYFVDYVECVYYNGDANYPAGYYWLSKTASYTACTASCNSDNTDCDSSGGKLYNY